MQQEADECVPVTRRFRLHLRCHNCMRESRKVIEFDDVDGAPRDVDDLLESTVLGRLSYRCRQCFSGIGNIFSATGPR